MKYTDKEIYEWLNTKNYQTEYEETGEYEMYFRVDMPKILNEFVDYIAQQSLSGSDDKSSSPKICPKCMGSGRWYMGAEDGEGFKCMKCNGNGQIF